MDTCTRRTARLQKSIIALQYRVIHFNSKTTRSEIRLMFADALNIKRKLENVQADFDLVATPFEIMKLDLTYETLFSSINKILVQIAERKRQDAEIKEPQQANWRNLFKFFMY